MEIAQESALVEADGNASLGSPVSALEALLCGPRAIFVGSPDEVSDLDTFDVDGDYGSDAAHL